MRLTHPPVIVRTYQDRSADQAGRHFKKDAETLARDGYSVSSITRNDADSVLYWWAWPSAKATVTVTYVRHPQ
jgi:hypothetical protein